MNDTEVDTPDVHIDLDVFPSPLTLDAVAVPLFVLNDDGTILIENEAARSMMGNTCSSLRGKSFPDLAGRPVDRSRLRALLASPRQATEGLADSTRTIQWPTTDDIRSDPSQKSPMAAAGCPDDGIRWVRCTIVPYARGPHPVYRPRDHPASLPRHANNLQYDAPNGPLFVATVEDQSEVRALQDILTHISHEERRRIGEDMHDLVASRLTVISIRLQNLQNRMRVQGDTDYVESIIPILETIQEAASRVRTMSHALCPVDLKETPLARALETLIASLNEHHQPRLIFSSAGLGSETFTEEVRTHVFRIAHEAVHNAIKHAQASWIRVDLSRIDHRFALSVWDDGVGISTKEWASGGCGIGQRLMECRADVLGATLSVDTAPNGGTLLQLEWPDPEHPRSSA